MTGHLAAVVEPADDGRAFVRYQEMQHSPSCVVRGPMPMLMAVSLAGWLNGAPWLTEGELVDLAKAATL